MTVYTLGPAGTFSHELAIRLYGQDVTLISTISGIFAEVEKGDGTGVIPLENSEAGGVGATLDGLRRSGVSIIAEAYREIHHHLAAFEPLEGIERIYVHPQTHEQCSRVLDRLDREIVHTSSNAASAIEMQKVPHSAAVVSRMTADLYGIPILCEYIENNRDNVTRFIVISARQDLSPGASKCSILIDPQIDRAGLLHEILGVFASRQINLTRIESRPSKRRMGSYVFFIDLVYSPGWKEAMSELERMTPVRLLGCYPCLEVPG
ncbi:MAG: ACT domain-containing protein [Methanoregulaceae archaeon]|nr:ACT domain-containing protein [Methanoregulaceae archaeon]